MKIGRYIARGGAPIIAVTYDLRNRGLSSAGIDALLIGWAAEGVSFKIIDIRGNERRTSASDAAVIQLTTTLNNELWEDE